MERRQFLTLAGTALTATAAGCTSSGDSTQTPTGNAGGTPESVDTATKETPTTGEITPTPEPTPEANLLAADVTGTVTGKEPSGIAVVEHDIRMGPDLYDGEARIVVETTTENVGGELTRGANNHPIVQLYPPDSDEPLDLRGNNGGHYKDGNPDYEYELEPGTQYITETEFVVELPTDITVGRYEIRLECEGGNLLQEPHPYC
jgi:hypothetical protein